MEKQLGTTNWFLCFRAGGHMIGPHWQFAWRGDPLRVEVETMPRHGQIVDGFPVLLPAGQDSCMRAGLGCVDCYPGTKWELVLSVDTPRAIFHWRPRWTGGGKPDTTTCPPDWTMYRTLPVLRVPGTTALVSSSVAASPVRGHMDF